MNVVEDEALGVAAITAVRGGDIESLRRLLAENPALATATITRRACGSRPEYAYPLIGAATDWPGHFPDVARTIEVLVSAGADVNARAIGSHRETPLHGAASSDDIEALDALLDAGAEIDAPGGVIAGGTPLDDAVAFGQWRAARRLVERGAATAIWHAAALGLIDRVATCVSSGVPPARHPWGGESNRVHDLNVAFWCACHGGQRPSAELLLSHGASSSWVSPWDGLTALGAARRSGADAVVEWLVTIGAR